MRLATLAHRIYKSISSLMSISPFLFLVIPIANANNDYPNGLFLIGLTDSGWRFFLSDRQTEGQSDNHILHRIDAIEHPRGGSYHPKLKRIAYLGSDNKFYEYYLESDTTVEVSATSNNRYSQPRYSQNGEYLLAVELPDGRSRRTNIIGINTSSQTHHKLVRKRTAQFEPQMMSANSLYYTTAICVDDCEGMIWELWHRDMRTAKQEQLTLMNAVARQPHLGYDGWLYFSSNAGSGSYNIWRMQPVVGSQPEQLTAGPHRDSSPATDRNGNIYFLRKDQAGTNIMKMANDKISAIKLPEEILDVRFLEVVQ